MDFKKKNRYNGAGTRKRLIPYIEEAQQTEGGDGS
jgi:hypothetical protein